MFKTLTIFTTFFLISSLAVTTNSFSQTSQIKEHHQNHLYNMSKSDINNLLQTISKKSLIERLEIISEKTKGTPYFLGPLGEGLQSTYDKNPLIDLTRVDCVTFVEQTLALALSNNYDTAFETLQKIRYKSAEIKIEKRNHYFMADWVINNHWLVNDVTKNIGGDLAKPLTRTISHEKFFANSVYQGIKAQEPDRNITINYIPKDKLSLIADKLQSGDIAAFVINSEGIFVSHTGLIIKNKAGDIFFRNATSIGQKQVVDLPYEQLIEYLKNSKRNMGLVFIRPKTI